MKLLFLTTLDLMTGGNIVRIKAESDGTMLYVTADKFPRDTLLYGRVSLNITYNGETKGMSSEPLSEMQVSFPYSNSVKQITVGGNELYYDGVAYGDSITFNWQGNYTDPTPNAIVTCNGVRHESQFTLNFSYNNSGYYVYPIAIYANAWDVEYEKWYRQTYSKAKSSGSVFSGTLSSEHNDKSKIEFYVYFAIYKRANDSRDEYIGISEYVTPIYVIAEKGTPFSPTNISYEEQEIPNQLRVSWNKVNDNSFSGIKYELERSFDGIEYAGVYIGSNTYYVDTIPEDARRVIYRVRAVSGQNVSFWYTGEEKRITRCNVYMSIDGVVTNAGAVYIGMNGIPVEVQGELIVGQKENTV